MNSFEEIKGRFEIVKTAELGLPPRRGESPPAVRKSGGEIIWQLEPFFIAESRFFESATSRTTAAGEDALTRPGCGWPLPHLVSSECEKPFCRRFATWLRKSSACSLNADRSSSIVRVNSSEPSGAAITFAHMAAIRSLISISIGGERAVGCQTNSLHGIQKIIHHDRVVPITPSWGCSGAMFSITGIEAAHARFRPPRCERRVPLREQSRTHRSQKA